MSVMLKNEKQESLSTDLQKKGLVASFPHLVYLELLAILGVMLFFILASIYYNAPLEEIANPSETPNPAKAPWYFVGFQELLTYFDPWIGGVIIPLLIMFGLMSLPFLARGRSEDQSNSPPYKKLASWIFASGLSMWFLLIVIGQFFRGPDWGFYWPWESTNMVKEFKENLWSFSYPWGLILFIGYFSLFLLLPALQWRGFRRHLGTTRYAVFTVLLALFCGVILKIILRLFFGIKYVLITPWFNI